MPDGRRDAHLERSVGAILRIGVIVSAVIALAGGALLFSLLGPRLPHF